MAKRIHEPVLDGDRLLNRDISRLARDYPLLCPTEERELSDTLQAVPHLLRTIAEMPDEELGAHAHAVRALAAEMEAALAARCKQVSARAVSEELRRTVARGLEARKELAELLRALPSGSKDASKGWMQGAAALKDIAGEDAARQKLQYSNVLLAKHHCHGDWDLFQENMIAILRATYTYDPAHGCRFSTYASNAIRFLWHSYSKRKTLVHVAPYMHQSALRYREALERLHAADVPQTDEAVIAAMARIEEEWKRRHTQAPADAGDTEEQEPAETEAITPEQLRVTERASRAISPLSLDGGGDPDLPSHGESLAARTEHPLETLAGKEGRERVRGWLRTLAGSPHNNDRRAAELLRRYFELSAEDPFEPEDDYPGEKPATAVLRRGPTYKQLGEETGISRQMIENLIRHGKMRLLEIAVARGEQPEDEAAA